MDLNINEDFELVLNGGSADVLDTGEHTEILRNIILKEEFFFNKKFMLENIYNRKLYEVNLTNFELADKIKKALLSHYKEAYYNFEIIQRLGAIVIVNSGEVSVYYKDTVTDKLVFDEITRRV